MQSEGRILHREQSKSHDALKSFDVLKRDLVVKTHFLIPLLQQVHLFSNLDF